MKRVVLFFVMLLVVLNAEEIFVGDKWQQKIPLGAYQLKISAVKNLRSNKIDEAINDFKGAIKKMPNYYLATYNLALTYYFKKDLNATFNTLEQAYKIAKDNNISDVLIYNLFGYANMVKGDDNRSMAVFEEGMKTDANDSRLLNNYGLLEFKKGNYIKARTLFENSVKNGNIKAGENIKMVDKMLDKLKGLDVNISKPMGVADLDVSRKK